MRAWSLCLGLMLLASAGLAVAGLVPGRAQSRSARTPRGEITLAQAPARLRAAVRRDAMARAAPAARAAVRAGATAQAARRQLRASYSARSVHLDGATWAGTVGLGQVGRATALTRIAAIRRRGAGGGARYGGAGVQEAFTAVPTGIEQSFAIARRPAGSGPLVLRFGLAGIRVRGSGTVLAMHGDGGRLVGAYSGLRATDASGRSLTARMSAADGGRSVVIEVSDRHARYPLRIDPTFTQTAELTDPAATSGDLFGYAVAVSGSTALIGAPGGGEAYIYTSNAGGWTQTATLAAPSGATDFGDAVAISGTTAVVGAPSSSTPGAAYVYTLSAGSWTYTTELTSSDEGADDDFGTSVATSGGTIAVGAPYHGSQLAGATYIYTLSQGSWSQTAELTPADGNDFDFSGSSVAISESGSTVVAGAFDDSAGIGSAYVFTLSNGSWSQAALLIVPNSTPSIDLAASVAISGSTIVVGGSEYTNGDAGQAYVYTPSGVGWSLAATLNPADSGGFFGRSVAISGNTIVIGAFGHDAGSGSNQGAAYVFTGSGSTWTQQPTDLLASDGAPPDGFGWDVAVAGSTILVGTDVSGGIGTAYFFGIALQTGPTFTVTSTADTDDGGCYVGDCTLRDALGAVDSGDVPGATIAFDLPAGVQAIVPVTPLPAITSPVTVDATTEAGYAGTPLVDLEGVDCASPCDGLDVSSGQTTIRGLAIGGFPGEGIALSGDGGDTVAQDWIGWSPLTGSFDGDRAGGIDVADSAGNTIGGDAASPLVVAGNGHGVPSGSDIEISGTGSFANVVANAWIGVGADGTSAGQDAVGLALDTGATANAVGGSAGLGDVIDDYTQDGVLIDGAGTGNTVAGDTIGADPAGQVPGSPEEVGIGVQSTSGTVIGDDAAPGSQADTGNGNEIVGNVADAGILLSEADDTTVAGNRIGTDAGGDGGLGNGEGIHVAGGATGNVIGPGNTIADGTTRSGQSGDGIEVDATGNEITANSIHDNEGTGIAESSFTTVPAPTLTAPSPQEGPTTIVNGTVTGTAGSPVAVDLFDSPACGSGQGQTYLGTATVTIGAGGTAPVSIATDAPAASDDITATATTTLPGGSSPSTSVFSGCSSLFASADNDEWTTAQTITPNASGAGSASGSVDLSGQARWYKVPISPGGSVSVDLSNLPANYDLALFSDIGQAEANLSVSGTSSLQTVQTELPGDSYSPSEFSPSEFSPSEFSPSEFSPSEFSPSEFSPSEFSPSEFSPSEFSPSEFSPSEFSPSVTAPSEFSPSEFSPSEFSPSEFSPSSTVADEQDYEDAQIESLLAVSDNGGDANQSVSADTWNNTGYFYIRVSGANGAYDPGQDFSLGVQVNGGTCQGVEPSTAALLNPSFTVPGSGYQTLILTDEGRMTDDGDLAKMEADLQTFAGEASVDGTIVDVGAVSPRVAALETQADQNADCPYAENLVAESIRDVVTAVRAQNPGLKYIVIIGDDHVIPFFRYPDTAGIGPESDYVPPVLDTTPSYASLESDDFLSQDAYGATTELDAGGEDIPVPDLPVGRLVETPTEIDGMLQAYMSLTGGVVATPTSSLVTGYDFMTSGADAVESDLAAGLGPNGTDDTLITNDGVAPSDTGTPPTQSWTASQLESALLGKRHDLIFLAGHFSANNTLAADYSTTMNATQLASSSVNLENSIVFSAGCHSGYNIAAEDAVPGITQTTDWVGAFAQHEATLIAGTGYQYGDTDFLAYSEQLYADFSHALRLGSGPVAVGSALVNAKSTYLDDTANLQGIDIKALLESTLYGLPMLSVNLPAGRIAQPTSTSIVSTTTPAATNPGAALGLSSTDVTLSPTLTANTSQLESLTGGTAPLATYLSGPGGAVSTSPAEPTLPLSVSDVSVPGQVLRGVGFTGGTYSDQSGITPLTGAPATELSGEHSTFSSSTFFPSKLFTVNYFGGLNGGPASTKLMLTPAQYESDAAGSLTDTQRSYSSVGLRLFYSDNTSTYGSNTPALAAPPTIGQVDATTSGTGVSFQAHVVGDPSAGIQQVWVTYSGVDQPASGTGEWESLDLTQSPTDSTLWTGSLTGLSPAQISGLRFIVQAVNGVGLVGVDDNNGAYFQPGQIPPQIQSAGQPLTPTTLALNSPPASGGYGSTATVSATLSGGGGSVANQPVSFTLGGSTAEGVTNGSGVATAQIPVTEPPGSSYPLTAAYDGTATVAGSSSAPASFAVTELATTLTLSGPSTVTYGASTTGISATLQSDGLGVGAHSVTFVLTPTGSTSGSPLVQTAITSLGGVAQLGSLGALAPGTYSVAAFFGPGGPLTVPADPILAPSTTASPLALTVSGQAPAFTSVSSTTFTVGSAGMFTVTTTGVPANTISLGTGSGCAKLPTGVSFADTGNTATLSGTPAAGTGGSYALCLIASNGVGTAATQGFTLTVDQAPALTSASSATFTVGSAGKFTLTSTGVPANTITLGTASGCAKLPSGVTFSDAGNTATLAGTPAAGTSGAYALCLTASNGVGTAATQAFTLTVDQAPAFTSASSATFTVGSAGKFSVTSTGVPANTISLGTASGCAKPPSGVTFSDAGDTATLSGTPAAGTGGTYALCLTAANGAGSPATQSFTLTVDQAPAFTSATSATFTVGSSGTFTVTATGFPADTISLGTASGCAKLPSGVTFSDTGNTATLSGTPAAGTGGTYALCLTASNGIGTAATQCLTLTIDQAPAITSASSATITVGSAAKFSVTSTGVPANTITLGTASGCAKLPSGVTFSDAGNTATLSGTPAAGTGGTYALCLTASNGVGSAATQTFTLTVATPLGSGTTACSGPANGTGANVTVASGAICTLVPGTHVTGNITVSAGGALSAQGVTIAGNVTTTSAKWITLGGGGTIGGNLLATGTAAAPPGADDALCAGTISGNLEVQTSGSAAPFDIGDLGACSGGPGLTVKGNLLVESNAAAVTIGGNTVSGNLLVQSNTATLTISANIVSGNIQVSGNTVGVGGTLTGNSAAGNCQLSSDKPTIAGSKNTAKGQNTCNASA